MLIKRLNPADLADTITNAIGSWNFIIIQTALMAAWFVLNSVSWFWHWDPYPFVFLNLFMSMEAAYATPIILMSGNRQQTRDETQREADRQTLDRIESIEQTLDAHVNGTAQEHSQQLADLKILLAEVHGHVTTQPEAQAPAADIMDLKAMIADRDDAIAALLANLSARIEAQSPPRAPKKPKVADIPKETPADV